MGKEERSFSTTGIAEYLLSKVAEDVWHYGSGRGVRPHSLRASDPDLLVHQWRRRWQWNRHICLFLCVSR